MAGIQVAMGGQGLHDGHAKLHRHENDADNFQTTRNGCQIEGPRQPKHTSWRAHEGANFLHLALKKTFFRPSFHLE